MEPLTNWANRRDNRLTRPAMEKIVHIHRDAELPEFHRRTFVKRAADAPAVNTEAPAHGRKAVPRQCFANYNNPDIGEATRAVLAHNGVETEVAYPGCCGMPKLEQGDLPAVAEAAHRTADALLPWVDQGHEVIALVPSCALMLKFEMAADRRRPEDPAARRERQWDVAEYVVDIARHEGLAEGLKPSTAACSLHLACRARPRNMGPKAADMLRLIPDMDLEVQERCSGHGGAWGVKKENFEVAIKVGKPLARRVSKSGRRRLASECPLAGADDGPGAGAPGG
ncbi:MAG: heterodisulfide reductase-related iron-sulfur binding cluster [Arhodomonas sp.]|nr:heterodisulfide reductase-related iron-sulfur binding cluster [Arhodomonas sp.]